jgi:phosphoribosyl 1,2-cyclic phosphodiesterase
MTVPEHSSATLPAIGVTVLGSGSQGNAIVVHTAAAGVLVDAGFSRAELRRRLDTAQVAESILRAIVITHEHEDHIKGLRVTAKSLDLPVYCNRLTAESIRARGHAPDRPFCLFTAGAAFEVGGFRVEPFSIPHDAVDPSAFIFRLGDRKIAIVTDIGHASGLVQHHLRECDLLVLESNHEVTLLMNSARPMDVKHRILGKHGHLSNVDSMELLKRVAHPRTRHVILAHASQECNRYELVEQHACHCLKQLDRHDIRVLIARQDACLPTVWV